MSQIRQIGPRIIFLFFAFIAFAASSRAQDVIAPGAKLQKPAGDFIFTEGATCDKSGNVFFVDQPNNRIMEWTTNGQLSIFMHPSGHANGMEFDARGSLVACADEHNELWSISPDKTVTVLVTNFDGKYLNGPNDVWIAPNGGMYMTDPFYKRDWWDHTTMAQSGQDVYYLSPDRKQLSRVIDDFKKPNGITGAPDGKTLYVSDIGGDRTWRYDILPDGSLTNKTLFCAKGSDGMTMDEKGDVYITGHGVWIYDKSGKQIGHIDVPESWTGNLCFGGAHHNTLFITASTSLYSIQMQVRGANAAK
ncbi:MAG TPA: SMP-30/gluconolactonase/LRE family protein [Verrucomicrobiae bacterium]|jgi:gluconolactonase|nr:SMP-30/gluconolactonase/LRE family protein [Verrucomicrobiae bacterium]